MAVIEDFPSIISTLTLAKTLYDCGRFDVVEKYFFDELCWDDYYHNMLVTIEHIFTRYESYYNEDDCYEIMYFEDEVISKYFVYAWEYGKKHDLHFSQNPYVSLADEEVKRWLYVSNCSSWKLSAYVRSKKSAQRSRIFVYIDTSCGCTAHENIAYGLVQLYAWFAEKNTEFDAMKTTASSIEITVPDTHTKEENLGVMAA